MKEKEIVEAGSEAFIDALVEYTGQTREQIKNWSEKEWSDLVEKIDKE